MSKIRQLSDQSLRELAEMKRKSRISPGEPLGRPPAPSAPIWYWIELLDDLDAPSNGWTGATLGYGKIMVPDPDDPTGNPRDFVEMATGAVTGATNASPVVITSTAHGRKEGELVYVKGVLGNLGANGPYRVGAVTADTFSLVGSTGSGTYTSGGNWYAAVEFVNRDESLSASDGVIGKVEWAFGEYSLKWIGC